MAKVVAMRDPRAVTRTPSRAPEHLAITDAIGEVSGVAPDGFVRFADLACAGGLEPQFTEHSVRFGDRLERHRLTHYFDVGPSGSRTVLAVLDRLTELAAAMEIRNASGLAALGPALLRSVASIEQVVLGIDARTEPGATRLKLYLVFSRPAPEAFELLTTSLGITPPPGLAAREVRLVGVDLSQDGASDLKAYLRLDPRRLDRVFRDPDSVRDLANASREVVLQQGLGGSQRRQLHFHATDEARFARWMVDRASNEGLRALLDHQNALNAALSGIRMAPWIIGLPYADGRADESRGNVYFHPMPR